VVNTERTQGSKREQPLAISMNLSRRGYSAGTVISGGLTILFGKVSDIYRTFETLTRIRGFGHLSDISDIFQVWEQLDECLYVAQKIIFQTPSGIFDSIEPLSGLQNFQTLGPQRRKPSRCADTLLTEGRGRGPEGAGRTSEQGHGIGVPDGPA